MDSEQPIEIKPTPNYQSASIVKEVNSEGEREFMNMENRYEVEKDAIFINYDKEDLIKKLSTFQDLDIYQRITYARHINVIRDELQETHGELVGRFVQGLVHEGEEIKRHLLQQLKEFVEKDMREAEKPRVYLEIKDIILPALLELLKSGILDIKEQAGNILGLLSSKLKEEEFQRIVTAAGALIGDEEEDNKIVGVQVLSRLSQSAQTEFVQNFVCKEILKAASSESIRVKKEAILCIPLVCNKISDEFFEKEMLPFFQKKCSENSWAVRKACVEIITSVQPRARNIKERGVISNELLSLLKDGNKLVKINAHKILPLYISQLTFTHAYHQDDLSFKLLDLYFKLIDSDVNNMAMSSEILYQISYTFPAVLLALGKTYWKKLFPIFSRLLRHTQMKVRQPLAYSFHEVAKIIGEEQSKNCLFECLDNILKDTYDNLKLGAIEHLAQFVQIFNSEVKQNLVDVFLVLQKDPKKWRIRHSIATQLNKLIKIYDCDTVLKYILPISLKLCNDPVAEVSYEASKHVWGVLESLKEQASFKLVIESITGYSQSSRYTQRQVFLQIVKSFSKYQKSFQQLIIPELKVLARDKIAIVRIRLAELIHGLNETLKSNADIQEIISILKEDPDDDVRHALDPSQTQ